MAHAIPIALTAPDRLDVLYSLGLLGSPAAAAYDRLTCLTARVLAAPTAFIALVEPERQFFLSSVGLPEPWASRREAPLSHSLCQYVVAERVPLLIGDTTTHPAGAGSEAIGALGIVAYAGFPLITPEGHILGTLCATDSRPREWLPEDAEKLADLAAAVMTAIELHQARVTLQTNEGHRRAIRVQEQLARLEAARAAERTARLYNLTATLSQALSPQQVAEVVIAQSIAALGAYAGVLLTCSPEDASLCLTHSIGHPPAVVERWQHIPIAAPVPAAEAARTGSTIWLPSRAELFQRFPSVAFVAGSPTEAMVAIPLCVGATTVAVLVLSFATAQPIREDDQTLLLYLTEQCAQALDRAQAHSRIEQEQAERRRAERALVQQTHLYEHLLQAQSDLGEMVLMLEDERIVFANDAATWLTGYSRSELLAMPSFAQLLTPESQAILARRQAEMPPHDVHHRHVELTLAHTTGRRVEVEAAATDLRLDGVNRWVVLVRDITARKQVETDLLLSQRALAAVGSGILITDARRPGHRAIYCNPAFMRITGYSEDEILGRNCRFLQGPGTDPAAIALIKAALDAGRMCHTTLLNYRKDGSSFWNDLIIAPVHDAGGSITHFVGIQTDVSERVEAEEALRRNTGLLDAIVEHIPHMLIVKDARELRFVHFNRAGEELVGLPREALIGHRDADFFPPEEAAFFTAKDREVLAGTQAVDIPEEPLQTRHQGRRWLHTKKIPIATTGGAPDYLLVISEDITERKQAANVRQALERHIQETQKLDSLGMLAGGIAHDFNNMLVSVLGNAELALADLEEGHPARASVEQLRLASRRAAELTSQLLAYSGRGRFVVGPVDLNTVVVEMTSLLRAAIPRAVAVEVLAEPGLPQIEADATQLRQVVMNLVINAAEAMGGNPGRVVVRTGRRVVDRAFLAGCYLAADLQPGLYVAMDVTDTGAGMDEATRARVFEPFFSTKRAGRGLGLAAVLGIVRTHKGTLHIRSAPGRGTTFTVLLPPGPLAEQALREGDPTVESAPSRAVGTVLVIDDEEGVRRVLARMLARLGYAVIEAASGEEGIATSVARPEVRAVLLDLTMPGLSGEQTFQGLRAARAKLPVVIISGYSEQEVRSRLGSAAGIMVVQKPFSAAELRQALQAVLA